MIGRPGRPMVLVLLTLGALVSSPTAWANAALQITSATASAGQGAPLTVSINSEVTGLCGLMLNVKFDTAAPSGAPPMTIVGLNQSNLSQSFAGAIYGAASPQDPVTGVPMLQQRRIAIVHADPVDGPADVISIPFQVPDSAAAGTVYTVSVSAVANDFQGVKFPVDPASGTITVGGQAPVMGDVDGDGRVAVNDAILALRAAIGLATLTPDQIARADINKHGTVDVSDAVAILRLAVGLTG